MKFIRATVFFVLLIAVAAGFARLFDPPRSTTLILFVGAVGLCLVLLAARALSGQRRLTREFHSELSAVSSLSPEEAEWQTMQLAEMGSVKLVAATGPPPAVVDQAGPALLEFLRHYELVESEELKIGWRFLRRNGDRIVLGEEGLTFVFESPVREDEIRVLSREGEVLFSLPTIWHVLPWKWSP